MKSASSRLKLAARLSPPDSEEDQLRRVLRREILRLGEIAADILADGGVGATPGLYRADARGIQRLVLHEVFAAFSRVKMSLVMAGATAVIVSEVTTQGEHQGGLSSADGSTDADGERALG